MKHVLELAAFVAASAPLALLPRRLSARTGEFLGLVLYFLWGKRRGIAVENIRRARERGALAGPESPEKIARRTFMNLGRWASEIAKVYYGRGNGIVRDIRVEGMENFLRAKQKGRGVMVVGGHCGNWELMGVSLPVWTGRFCGVARKQSNPYIDRFIVRARKRFGSEIVYKDGALRKFINVLKEGGTVGVLVDQAVVPSEGFMVDFLGAPAWTTRMPVALARRTGAALVPIAMHLTGEGHVMRFFPEVELGGDDEEDTQKVSSHIESFIRENPAQWLWIHRRWKRTGQAESRGRD